MSTALLISRLIHCEILWTYKLDDGFIDLKCPFVGIIDTARSIRLEWVVARAPRPDIVTTLDQVIVDNVIIPRQVKASIPALAVAGSFI